MTLSRLRAVWLFFFFFFFLYPSFSSGTLTLEELLEDPKFTRTGYTDLALLREKAEGFLTSLQRSSPLKSKDLETLEKLCLTMARQTGLAVYADGFILDRLFHRRFSEHTIGQFYSIPQVIFDQALDSVQYLTNLQNEMRIRSEASVKNFPPRFRSIPRDRIYGIADAATTVAAAITPSVMVTPEWFSSIKWRLADDVLAPSDCLVLTVMPEHIEDAFVLLRRLAAIRLKISPLVPVRDFRKKYPILGRIFRDPYVNESVAIESWAPLLDRDKEGYAEFLRPLEK